jgi:hypothetical protein
MRERQDRCFQCQAEIPLRYGYVPICQPCLQAYDIQCAKRRVLLKKLSKMGAAPGKRTKRYARLKAVQDLRIPPENDNGLPFGEKARTWWWW